jgi:hypothetical protein
MYFRLAAAFATPTKTGDFGESLGLAAQQMAEYKGEQREAQKAAQQQRRDLALELGKLDLETAQSAYERSLTAQQPKGDIGRNCADLYAVGTPEYMACLEARMKAKDEQAAATQAWQEAADQRAADLAAQRANAIPTAMQGRMIESQQIVNTANNVLANLQEALRLNPGTYSGGWLGLAERLASGDFDPNSPEAQATKTQENVLSRIATSQIKIIFSGASSDTELKISQDLQGGTATRAVRGNIIRQSISDIQARRDSAQQIIDDIKSRNYSVYDDALANEESEEEAADGE